ncbi:MAG: YraN family protein [Polyangiaceae bacterium]
MATRWARAIAAKTERPNVRHTRGARAEAAVREHLTDGGFFVEGQNVRFGALEIDIIARRADLLVACEVRYRSGVGVRGPLASITHEKRQRILRAARLLYDARVKTDPTIRRFRIDVAVVHFGPAGDRVEYFPGAITADA